MLSQAAVTAHATVTANIVASVSISSAGSLYLAQSVGTSSDEMNVSSKATNQSARFDINNNQELSYGLSVSSAAKIHKDSGEDLILNGLELLPSASSASGQHELGLSGSLYEPDTTGSYSGQVSITANFN